MRRLALGAGLPTAWRQSKLRTWLASDRIDAQIARDSHLTIDEPLIHRIRKTANKCDGWTVGVMCGAFMQ